MKERRKLAPALWVLVIMASMAAGVGVVWASGVWRAPSKDAGEFVNDGPVALELDLDDSVGMRYARAVQRGDADNVIEMTLWMTQRLQRVAMETSDPSELENARADLRRGLVERAVEGNQLTLQGIEDKYLFSKGASLKAVGATEGRNDLHVPAKACTWIRVTYPLKRNALRDGSGEPIRAVTAGIHESQEGLVLKAGVSGNAEIDFESISYDWDLDKGEE